MNAKFRTEIRNGLAAVWREGALLIWLIMMNGAGALGAGLPANLEPGDVVPETKSMTSEDLKAATGIGDAGSSGWRMVLRGATAEPYLFQARWADVSEFGMSRCVMHKLYVGPYDEYPFCYAGEYCCNCFGGYQDLNYEPWLQGAQHIIETWATLAGVLFQSDENFHLHLQFSAQGLAYVSGRGTARYRTGETILLGQDITIATWRKLAAGTGLAADGGIIALGYLKDTNGFDILAAALNDTNTSRRIKAVEALGRIGTPASVTFLAKAAADTNETVAEVVAESLGKAGQNSPAATAALVSFIGRASNVNSPREADVALWSLKQLAGVDKALSENTDLQMLEADPQTIAQLLEMAKDKSVANRRGLALRACALLASSGVNPLLSQSLSDRSSSESSELLALCALRHVEGADMDKLAAMADDSKMDKFTRRIAIWMAGRAGKEKAVPRLLPYLKDATDPEVRRGALLGLGQSGSSAAAEPLKAFCDAQTNDEARDSAAEALSMLGQKATGQLEALAKSAASRVRYHALKGLAQGDSTEAIPFLVEGLGDELQATRKVAWDGLKARHWTPKSGREQVLSVIAAGEAPPAVTNLDGHTVEQLVKMMGNGDAKARKAVAAALGSTRGEPATGALVKALRDGDVMVRLAAARSLESQSWKPVADGDNIRLLAAKLDFEGCSKLGPKAAPALVELLLADYGFCREWISQTLIQIGPSCIPTLTPQLGAKYDADVRMIASTLVAYGGPALEPLQKVLKEGDPRKRIWAARALRNLGNDQALPALQAALQAAPAPQTGLSRPGFQIINQSTWNQNDRTPEGAARNAIQFAITALQKKSQ